MSAGDDDEVLGTETFSARTDADADDGDGNEIIRVTGLNKRWVADNVRTHRPRPFDPRRHAGNLSIWITGAFVFNVTAWMLFTACVYGRLPAEPTDTQLQMADRVAGWIQALSAVLSGPLGYVLAYYFHKRESDQKDERD